MNIFDVTMNIADVWWCKSDDICWLRGLPWMLWTLCADFLDEDREWLDVSGVFSPPPDVIILSNVLVGVVTAIDGWTAADAEPDVKIFRWLFQIEPISNLITLRSMTEINI